jgi:hypothetical protein
MKNLIVVIFLTLLGCTKNGSGFGTDVRDQYVVEIGTKSRLQAQGYIESNQSVFEDGSLEGTISVALGSMHLGDVAFSGYSIWLNQFDLDEPSLIISGSVGVELHIAVASVNMRTGTINRVLYHDMLPKGQIDCCLDLGKIIWGIRK